MNLLDVINVTDKKEKELRDLASTVNTEIKKINHFYDEEKIKLEKEKETFLNQIENLSKEDLSIIQDAYECNCLHDIVIKTHGSFITGKENNSKPNPNHVIYTCVGCLKKLKEEDITPEMIVLDYFGHEDALKIGYNDLAIVDYIRNIIEDCLSYDEFSDEELEHVITKGFCKVPKEYIRRS